jgi:hypothetical protein
MFIKFMHIGFLVGLYIIQLICCWYLYFFIYRQRVIFLKSRLFIMERTIICCKWCNRTFRSERACTMHIKYCSESPENRTEKPRISAGVILSSFQSEKMVEKNLNNAKKSSIGVEQGIANSDNGFFFAGSEDKNMVDERNVQKLSPSKRMLSDEVAVSNHPSFVLLNNEANFQQRMQFTHQIWSNESVGKLELLKILQKHNCASNVYKEVMGWANHYAVKKDCKLFTDSVNVGHKNVFLRELQYRRDMKGMEPKIEQVDLSFDGVSNFIDVTTFDFKNQLLSILRDEELMEPSNLVIDESSLIEKSSSESRCQSENLDNDIISEINDTDWYTWANEYYNKNLGVDKKRVLCGIILTIDKTHTDAKGKLCLEPVQFSLSILNTETRKKNPSAWKCLGFINDFSAYMFGKYHSEIERKSLYKKLRLTEANLKSINYHRILSCILKSLKDVQKEGLYWDLKLSSGQKHRVKFMFPVCLCVVDMKGGRQLCGKLDSAICSQPSLSCTCTSANLDKYQPICDPILDEDVKSILHNFCDSKEYEKKLSNMSQQYIPRNAFFDLDICEWPFGIWGLCPSEILHQFYEGVIIYMLDEFLKDFLPKVFYKNLEIGVQRLLNSIRDQSAKDSFPCGVFTFGMLRLPKSKGIEKFACVFYLSLFLHTSLARTENFEGKKPICREMWCNLLEWRKLFESCCYYNDWMSLQVYSRKDLSKKRNRMILFHQFFKKMIKRKGSGIKTIPKFHEFFHIVRNIERHGPPCGYSTITTESTHIPVKIAAKGTSHHIDTFPQETGKRMYERTLIDNSYSFVSRFAKSLYHKRKKRKSFKSVTFPSRNQNESVMISSETPKKFRKKKTLENKSISSRSNHIEVNLLSEMQQNAIEDNFQKVGIFFIKWNVGDKSIRCIYNMNDEDSHIENSYISNSKCFEDFIVSEIFMCLKIPENIKHFCIPCYTSVIRKGLAFRSVSRDKKNFPGWAIFQYEDEKGGFYPVPGKLITFIDISKCEFKDEYSDKYAQKDMHVIIESLTEMPKEKVLPNRHSSLCKNVEIISSKQKGPHIWCVSINTILDVAYIIPDLGNKNTNKYLYVFPRHECLDDSMMLDSIGWANKF